MLDHECRMCGVLAESHAANVQHMMTHLRSYLCMLCGEEFERGEDLARHADQHDGGQGQRPRVVVVDLVDESDDDADDDCCCCADDTIGGVPEPVVESFCHCGDDSVFEPDLAVADLVSDDDREQGGAGDVARESPGGGGGKAQDQPHHCSQNEVLAGDAASGPQPAAAPSPPSSRPPCARCSRPGPLSRKKSCLSCTARPLVRPSRRALRSAAARGPRSRVAQGNVEAAAANEDLTPTTAAVEDDTQTHVPAAPQLEPGRGAKVRHKGLRKKGFRVNPAVKNRSALGRVSSASACASTPTSSRTNCSRPISTQWVDDTVLRYSMDAPLGRKCIFCKVVFKSCSSYRSRWHVLYHLNMNIETTCLSCGANFKDRGSLAAHFREHNEATRLTDSSN